MACNNGADQNKVSTQQTDRLANAPVDCDESLQALIIGSTLKSPFRKDVKAFIEKQDGNELTVQLLVAGDKQQENIVGSLVIDLAKRTINDITNDLEDPDVLRYQASDWDRFVACRKASGKRANYISEESALTDLFPEGSTNDFTTADINTNGQRYAEFKNKLAQFANEHPRNSELRTADLLILINNEVFSNSNTLINSAWLTYFLDNYQKDNVALKSVMELAIQQEDLDAVIILFKHGFVISAQQLTLAAQRQEDANQLITYNKENKGLDEAGDPTFYETKYSRINDITRLITRYYNRNVIHDTDGYTNLRQGRINSSAIIGKVTSGTRVKVLDNTQPWYYVETISGQKGYIYHTKISSLK